METIKVFSTIDDKDIKKNLSDSPIWGDAYTEDELIDVDESKKVYQYSIKFDGLKPIQVTKVKRIR